MTTITLPRATVEQVLEALEYGQHSLKQVSEYQWESRGELAMQALRAALAQQVEPAETFLITGNEFCGAPPAPYATWGDALAGTLDAGKIEGLRISALAQQAYTDDLNQRIKLYVGSRCAPPQQAEPFTPDAIRTTQTAWKMGYDAAKAETQQAEPVAWLVTTEMQDGTRRTYPLAGRFKDVKDVCDFGEPVPLYTTPPQRKPLTQEEAATLVVQDNRMRGEFSAAMELIRRTERAHNIKEKR